MIDTNYNNSVNYNNTKNISETEIKQMKRSGEMDCQTCKGRKYVDGSDDAGVSYQTPTNISPAASMSKVYSHEQEHKSRENAEAIRENKEVVSNTISVTNARCHECGKSYVSGGVTNTITRTDTQKQNEQKYFSDKYYQDTIGKHYGQNIDSRI